MLFRSYIQDEIILNSSNQYEIYNLDTSLVRNKELNSYYQFDENAFMSDSNINQPRVPTETEIYVKPYFIDLVKNCRTTPVPLSPGYSGYVAINGVEQPQSESASLDNIEVPVSIYFITDRNITLEINDQKYSIIYHCGLK